MDSIQLRRNLADIVGEAHCSTEGEVRQSYASDMWPQALFWKRRGEIRYLPDGVVFPGSPEEIRELFRFAQKKRIPLIPFGGGSGVCGGTLPLQGGIILDLQRLNRFISLDRESCIATAEGGIRGDILDAQLLQLGFTMGHYPASLHTSTLGGWVATRASGQLSTQYGSIEDRVLSLKAVLPDGEWLETPLTPRGATGPDWNALLIGSEGVLGVVTEVTFKILPLPRSRLFVSFSFENMDRGFAAVKRCLQSGVIPAAVRLYDELDTALTLSVLGMPISGVLLILTFEGDEDLTAVQEKRASEQCESEGGKRLGEAPARHWWKSRFDLNKQLDLVLKEPRTLIDTIDVSALWSDLPSLYRAIKEALSQAGPTLHILCHLSHAYPQGASLYFTFVGVPPSGADEDQTYESLWNAAMEACLSHRGTISHHHGIGYLKGRWMERFEPTGLELFRRIKKTLDPAGVLNPGKMGL